MQNIYSHSRTLKDLVVDNICPSELEAYWQEKARQDGKSLSQNLLVKDAEVGGQSSLQSL